MHKNDRRKLMVGGAAGAAAMTVALPALADEEGIAVSGTITEFYQFLGKFRALPPKVQKAVLITLKWDTQRGLRGELGPRIRYKSPTTPTWVGPTDN